MTGREVLDKRVRRVRLFSISSVVVIIGALLAMTEMRGALSITHPFMLALTLGAIAAGFALAVAGQFALSAVRCPWCAGELGSLVFRKLSIAHAKFCVHCGKSLDDTLAADGKPKEATLNKAAAWDDELA